MKMAQRLMAHGFAGCLCSAAGAAIGIAVAYATLQPFIPGAFNVFDPGLDAYFMHLPEFIVWLLMTAIWLIGGAISGVFCGFVAGVVVNILFVRRSDRAEKDDSSEPN